MAGCAYMIVAGKSKVRKKINRGKSKVRKKINRIYVGRC
jgi:hypothetical protein